MPFVYVPLKTFQPSLEEVKKELYKLSECYKNLENKGFDPISWFEKDLDLDIKNLEKIIEKISSVKQGGKILGRFDYIKREVKNLKEKRAELILGNYYTFYSSGAKEIFSLFSDFLKYLTNFVENQ
ncbi:MAG: hypothetical protein ACP5O8_03385 [Candidatus Aenigmatarchaeota archaeon]